MLEHGGKLRDAAIKYEIPLEKWLDLSTGINPNGWPAPSNIPPLVWNRLPEDNDSLITTAQAYYGAGNLLAVAGSQMAIQALPRMREKSRVAMLHPSYNEHHHAWQSAQHHVQGIEPEQIDEMLPEIDVLLLVNPNNPTGKRFNESQLLGWHNQLHSRGGWLIVDEAFIDCTPQYSIAKHTQRPGLIVLRSVGKFFGLAGARIGFVCANQEILTPLKELIGPWVLSGPSRFIAKAALIDEEWHFKTRQRLQKEGGRLASLLIQYGLKPTGATPLFSWIRTTQAKHLHEELAKQAILTRLFTDPLSLRFGLPKEEYEWQRLEQALSSLQLDKS